MASNGEVTGECHECGDEHPTWELHVVNSTEYLCPSCYIEQCDHPVKERSPSGKLYCAECGGVVKGRGQTTLDGFTV